MPGADAGNSRAMSDQTKPTLDKDTIAFAGRVFDMARGGQTDALMELLTLGLPPNLRNDKGDTLVMLAAYHGRADTVHQLLEAGADPEIANDRGQTPLAAACFKGDTAAVEALLERVDVNAHSGDGRTALMIAAMFNRTEIMELLLRRGADPALQDVTGMTGRALAEAMGACDTAALLAAWENDGQG